MYLAKDWFPQMLLGGGERMTPGAAQNIPGKDAPRPGKECDKKTKVLVWAGRGPPTGPPK